MEQAMQTDGAYNWTAKKIAYSALWGVLFLMVSICINYIAGTYATVHEGAAVHDLILDNLPTWRVNFIFIDGIVLFFIFLGALVAHKPQRAPFVLKSLSLFILVRSFFIILTHLGPAANYTESVLPPLINKFTFTGDLFFSAHTGLPFLMALIFWPELYLRVIFFCLSIVFGSAVLFGHLHYSIDVFSAFFITYGIFHLAEKFFKHEFHLLSK